MFDRWMAGTLRERLARAFVHLFFGARQTGKSTLIRSLLPDDSLVINLADPTERSLHLADPARFLADCRALKPKAGGRLVFVDEAQTAPAIFDAVQTLYDSDKQRWRFVLCGSSARKLRRTGANLLPGRSFLHRLMPLVLAEQPPPEGSTPDADSPLPLPWPKAGEPKNLFPAWTLEERLAWGALPGVVAADEADRADVLRAFAAVHLEEEMRREAMVKDWGAFLRFLRLAAVESGQIINYSAIAQQTGLSVPTVKNYYQLLEDMFIGVPVPAWSGSQRKNLMSAGKFLLFDLGVRHAAAGVRPSPETVQANPGPLFEQWVGLEFWRRLQYLGTGGLHYLRSYAGAEVDYIVEHGGQLTPVEVKWTERPTASDARHVVAFLDENRKKARRGFIICRCRRPMQIHDRVTAIPWQCL
ncbi:MAG: ATP-binding protein [Verrucomicrobia bacterium]|nr:ATP-binding protein [Verrucomicrobiota bacterium]